MRDLVANTTKLLLVELDAHLGSCLHQLRWQWKAFVIANLLNLLPIVCLGRSACSIGKGMQLHISLQSKSLQTTLFCSLSIRPMQGKSHRKVLVQNLCYQVTVRQVSASHQRLMLSWRWSLRHSKHRDWPKRDLSMTMTSVGS